MQIIFKKKECVMCPSCKQEVYTPCNIFIDDLKKLFVCSWCGANVKASSLKRIK